MEGAAAATPVADRIERIPSPDEPIPRVSWPTMALFLTGLVTWGASTALYLDGALPWPAATAINGFAAFIFFTVLHECSHRAASTSQTLNTWLGRISALFLLPHGSAGLFRYVHMQHHRFTNDEEQDPDYYTGHGSGLTLPARWATIDFFYLRFYARAWPKRPAAEKRELLVNVALFLAFAGTVIATGHVLDALVLLLIPSRIAILMLGWSFDYLPHHDLHAPVSEKYKTTRNRVGLERLLSPLLLYQNYHLVHHLHPVIPFYRYIAVWRRNESEYLKGDPALSTVMGRPLSADEYRQLRRLEEH